MRTVAVGRAPVAVDSHACTRQVFVANKGSNTDYCEGRGRKQDG